MQNDYTDTHLCNIFEDHHLVPKATVFTFVELWIFLLENRVGEQK